MRVWKTQAPSGGGSAWVWTSGRKPLPAALSEHATISIAFVVDRILEVRVLDGGLGGMLLTETAVTDPYVTDYDAIEGAEPQRWPGRFDVSNWDLSVPAGTARTSAVP